MSESFNTLVPLHRQLAALAKLSPSGNAAAAPATAGPQGGSNPPNSPCHGPTTDVGGTNEGSRAKLEEQYAQEAPVLHSAVGLVAMAASHNPDLVRSAGLHVAPLLEMLQGATVVLKVGGRGMGCRDGMGVCVRV